MRIPSRSALFAAVRNHRAKEVAAILRDRLELVSATDGAGRTPLQICARQRVSTAAEARAGLATARALLKAGADVNAVQSIHEDGEVFPATALWYALAWGRNLPLASHLLKLQADPNHCMFALVWADDLRSAKLLRRYGAALDEVAHGETPLIYAIRHGRARFADWLIEEGANAEFTDRKGLTALEHARRRRLPASTLQKLRSPRV